jgi:hypothetical protein
MKNLSKFRIAAVLFTMKLFKSAGILMISVVKVLSRNTLRKAALLTSVFALMMSCSKDINTDVQPLTSHNNSSARVGEEEQQVLREEFGFALAKALKESEELRILIRKRALEMIDEDTDVLFALIRDEQLAGKVTVKDLIEKHLKNKDALTKIENEIPTLTIFVPELPNNSFSAQTWDTEKVIPLVGVKSQKINDVSIMDAEGNRAVLPSKYAPGFPVVIVKNSLRIVADSHPEFTKMKSKSRLTSSNGKTFRFLHDNFDRKLNIDKKRRGRLYLSSSIESKIANAYNIFGVSNNWQRDHIYYDMTPTQDKGAFSFDFKETLVSFRMTELDPMGAFNLINDSTNDPVRQPSQSTAQNTFWTGNSYSFRINVINQSKNGIGAAFSTLFPVPAHALWEIQYETVPFPGFWPWQHYNVYFPISVSPKYVDLREELFNWNLADYASTVLIRFEEVDTQINIEQTVTTTDTYAANFGVDGGIFKKLGLKFGGSATTTSVNTTKISYQEGSDEIGSATMNFADAVITDQYYIFDWRYNIREYPCGYARFVIRPVKVQ